MEIYVHFFLLYFSSVFNQAYSVPTLIYTNSIYAYVHKKIINMYYISSTHFDIHIEEWKKRFPHNDSTISLKMALHFELLDAYASSFLNSYAPSSHQTKLYFAVLYLNLQKFGQTFQGSLQLFLLKFKISMDCNLPFKCCQGWSHIFASMQNNDSIAHKMSFLKPFSRRTGNLCSCRT